MPRRRLEIDEAPRPTSGELAERLAAELRSDHESGQPVIYEQEFSSRRKRVTVIWDEWDRLSLEDRTATILKAYELSEERVGREKVALASGLTVPEAHSAGMLPFEMIAALRPGDPVTPAECREALLEEGASVLLSPDRPQLRFATQEEAEAARERLIDRLPGSEPVWVISQDAAKSPDWPL